MLGFHGPAQPSPALGDAINAGWATSRSNAWGATPTRRLRSASCDDQRRRRSMNLNATCGAGIRSTASRADVQAQPSDRTAIDEDFRQRSAINMVAGRTVKRRNGMTLVAVWRTDTRLMAIADTRIIRAPGNVLTEHGPKLLPLTIVCRQPGPAGFFDKEVYRASVGFAYSGATLSALAAHALASTLLSKLIGQTGAPPPSLHEIAYFVAGASAEYMRDVGQLSGKRAVFCSCLWLGSSAKKLRAFELRPLVQGAQLQVNVDERVLIPISVGGTAQSAVIIGSSVAKLTEEIDRQLGSAHETGAHPIVAFDAPKRALRGLISQGIDPAVGGSIQQAQATATGFEIIANTEPITPRPPSARNAGLFLLGFDTFDIQTAGHYQVASEGR